MSEPRCYDCDKPADRRCELTGESYCESCLIYKNYDEEKFAWKGMQ